MFPVPEIQNDAANVNLNSKWRWKKQQQMRIEETKLQQKCRFRQQ